MEQSTLQKERYLYEPKIPGNITASSREISIRFTQKIKINKELQHLFTNQPQEQRIAEFIAGTNEFAEKKRKIGLVFSGGQAPGGHNVVSGLFDATKKACNESVVIGFRNGPSGIVANDTITLTKELVDSYRNTGGFNMIGSGRTKIEQPQQFASAADTCKKQALDAIVIVGGDDSNTNALLLDEYFRSESVATQVIGIPKTIDGDLKNKYIECSFGFDTATRVYAELIGNIAQDAMSAKKYWHFIRLMGRSASHIALECALRTQPNVCIISEEVAAKQKTLAQIVKEIAQVIIYRANNNENFGVVLLPEGLIEFIPEVKSLISEINQLLVEGVHPHPDSISKKLRSDNRTLFRQLPEGIRHQLLIDRDPHGNVQVSRIETERLILSLLKTYLEEQASNGNYSATFSCVNHFFGYEGRSVFPTNFDADYCYSLGHTAFHLIANGLSGYMATVKNLASPTSKWLAGGTPLLNMIHMEKRHGTMKPVIKKALVDMKSPAFQRFVENRERWALHSSYLSPGAIQYFGPEHITYQPPLSL